MSPANHRPPWPKAIIPHTGTEVAGDRRFPRPQLEEEFDNAMNGGNGATLFGLRRIGKSSEALACAERLRESKQLVLMEDAQGMTSEARLLHAILNRLPAHGWRDRVMQIIGEDNAIAKTARDALHHLTGNTTEHVEAYFEPISAAIERAIQATDRVVLMVDELPWLCRSVLEGDPLKGRARIDVLLAALRRWRKAGMRMLLMGSIGLVGLGREYRLDLTHLNDLSALSVPPLLAPPLGDEDPEAFINALVAGGGILDWTDAHTRALLDESAAYYTSMLQRAFQQLTIGSKAAELGRFPEIFAVKIRPDLDETFYQQFDKRKQRYRALPEPLPRLVLMLIETVLGSESPVSRNALRDRTGKETDHADLTDALYILREDGFLTVRIERDASQYWRAASELVTAWWRQRRGGSCQ